MHRSRRLTFVVPGSIASRTGGYEYDRRIVEELRARGWVVDVHEVTRGGRLPPPPASLSSVPGGDIVIVDGLALDSVADPDREVAGRKLVALVHMPGASAADEDAAMNAARAIVVTGASAKRQLAAGGIDPSKIAVVEPGTFQPPIDAVNRRGDRSDVVRLLSVGNVTAEKGHDRLVSALQSIAERNWRLTIVGSLARDPEAVTRLDQVIRDSGLSDRIELAGELDAPAVGDAFMAADLFVLATLHETYGMAVAEAIAWELPVVSTSAGEISRIAGNGGIVVPPGDVGAFARALSSVLSDPALRARLKDEARRARRALRTWDQAGGEFSAVLERVAAG